MTNTIVDRIGTFFKRDKKTVENLPNPSNKISFFGNWFFSNGERIESTEHVEVEEIKFGENMI